MREFTFIRRYVKLNTLEESFYIEDEAAYIIQSEYYEEAVGVLIQQINDVEGSAGVLRNNGFPAHCATRDAQSFYLAMHSLSAFVYQQDAACSTSSFREQLLQSNDGEENEIYQGFYADEQLLYPRALTVHRLQCIGNVCNYFFETEGGRYQGEYDKYLWYDKTLYKGMNWKMSKKNH
ncbi:MAG: hypothetical protein E6713_09330 [Sporomusaceae bacterium]|nr:hypothetical protein [Sporomusaceae bacterium]